VLVATSVLSEGIDIQECSLVLCMDEIPTVTAFSQMRGRARKKGGSFVALVKDAVEDIKAHKFQRDADLFNQGPVGHAGVRHGAGSWYFVGMPSPVGWLGLQQPDEGLAAPNACRRSRCRSCC
jgi:hypothetical protein